MPDATAGLASAAPARVGGRDWRRWWRLRWPWLVATSICAVLAATLALLLPLPAGVGQERSPWEWAWWMEPRETNAFARLPRIYPHLFGVTLLPDGRALAVGDSGRVLRSADSGRSWLAAETGTDAHLRSVALLPDGRALAVGASGTVLRSANAGQSWLAAATGTNADLSSAALVSDGQALAVGNWGTVLRSANGGQSWLRVPTGQSVRLSSVALLADGQALVVGERGTVLRSRNAGGLWAAVPVRTGSWVFGVALVQDGRALAVGLEGVVLQGVDHGQSWVAATAGTWGGLSSAALVGDGTALAAGWAGALLRSGDGGRRWAAVSVGTGTGINGLALGARGMAVAVGWGGAILRSPDRGMTWSVVNEETGETPDLFGITVLPDGRAVAVGGDGWVLRSADGGQSWLGAETEPFAPLRSVALLPNGRALAVGDGGTVLRSGDFGENWAPVTARTERDLTGVALLPDGRALAVGRGGTVLRSGDFGQGWEQVRLHHRAPSPIVWVVLFAGLVAAAPLLAPLPPANRAASVGSLADILATDRPLERGEPDAAGAARLAERLSAFLRNRHTRPPLTLAITGEWGTGKSSVLNLLAADLRAHGLRPVWFNAWHHQKEEHLFAALLQAVRQQAVPPWYAAGGLAVRGRLAWARIRARWIAWVAWLSVLAAVGGAMSAVAWPSFGEAWGHLREGVGSLLAGRPAAWAWADLFSGALAPLAVVAALLSALALFRDRLKSAGLDPGKLMALAAGSTRWRDLGGQLAFRVRFADALKEVTDALGHRNLTILIDDLDRCDPRSVAEVMEAVNFLTSTAACFVVLAVARPQVLKAMGLAHAEMAKEMAPEGETDERRIRDAYAQRYLDKLIQIEIPVPVFDAAAARRLTSGALTPRQAPPDRAWRWAVGALVVCALLASAAGGGRVLWVTMHASAPIQGDAGGPAGVGGTFGTGVPAPRGGASGTGGPAPGGGTSSNGGPTGGGGTLAASVSALAAEPAWEASWLSFLLAPFIVVAGAVVLQAWRRNTLSVVDDAPEFAKALAHWSPAAFLARGSPREMKRFLNRLRLAATDENVPADATTVGLAVFAQVDRATVEEFVTSDGSLLGHLGNGHPMKSDAVLRDEILSALSSLEAAQLPAFEPDRERVKTFLAAWTGFVIR